MSSKIGKAVKLHMFRSCLLKIHAADYGDWEYSDVNDNSFLRKDNRILGVTYECMKTKRQ